MANTIDQRIVEMSFDNSKFNSNAEASIGVLDKLKKALKLDGSQDAFNKLESSSKKVNLSGLMSAVESISSKFTNLGIVGVTALQNITNSAINAGKNLISSLTIDPVMTGYNEYELKLNSIQTILANTQKEGATLEDVNRILNDLNTYADKTIYNFAQMTHNIGTFTAAGVDLQTSANAIKGIANLAALSGSNATQASTAMYQLSQAIAAGRVSLQDWNSVVNAGMGGQIFQDALRDTAEAMGIVVDRTESFRDSISAAGGATSWLTSDVLVSTLEIFTGDLTEAELAARGFNNEQIAYYLRLGKTAVDSATKVRTLSQLLDTLKESVQSGWATTWEIIFGNFEEATDLFTNINDVVGGFFNNMSDARNAMLLTWKDMGGREKLIENLSMAFRALQRVVEPVIKAFQNIFPPATAQQLMSFLGNIRTLAQTFMLSRNEMRKLQNAFEGLFSIIDIVGMTVSDVLSVAFDALNLVFDTFGGSVLDVASNLGEAIKAFRDWYKEVRPLKNGLEGLVNVARIVVTVAREIVSTVMQIPAVQSTIESIKIAFSNISATLQEAWGYVLEFVDGLMNLETISFDNIKTLFNQLLSNFSKLDVNLDSLGVAFDNIKNVASAALTQVSKAFENVKGVASSVAEFIKNVFSKINLGHILTAALAGTVIASLLSIKKLMDAIAEPIEAFTGMFKGVTNVLNAFAEKIKPNRFAENAKAIRDLAIAIGILAVSLAVLSKMDQQKLREAATTLGVLSGALIVLNGVMTLISKLGKGSGDVKGVSVNMLSAAASILIMVQALKQLQNLDQNGILKSLGIMAALMAGLSAMTIAISKFAPKLSTGSIMMLSSSASLLLMVKTLEQLQGMNLNGVEDSLKVMAVCMGLLAAVSIAAGKVKAGTAVGMLGIVASLALLVEVLKQVMALDLSGAESNLESIAAVILSFIALVGVSSLGGKNAQKAGVGILAMSASLLLIIEAIRQISKIGATEVSRAMGVITQIELLFGAIMALSHFAGGNSAKAGVGILAMSAAVVVLSGAMAIIATIDPAGLNRALEAITVLGVIFSMLLVATAVAKDASKQLIVATACVTVLAAVTAALGLIDPNQLQNGLTAVTLLSVVLSGLLVATKFSGPVNANLILATLAVGALGLVIAGLAQLPVGTALPIAESLSVLMLAMSAAMVIVSNIPITGALTAVANLGIFIAGLTAIVAALGGIAQIPGAKWLMGEGAAFLQNLGAALGGFVGGIVGGVVGGAISTISATLPGVAESLSSFMEKLQPFLDGLEGITPDMATAAKTIADALMTLTAGNFLSTITGFIGGNTSLSGFADTLSELGVGFKSFYDNVKDIDPSIVESSAAAAQSLAELENSLPNSGGKLAEWLGDNTLDSFGERLASFGEALYSYSSTLSQGEFNADIVTNSANAAMALAELESNIPNSGGKLAEWLGDNTLDSFGERLASFGESLVDYCDTFAGSSFDPNVVSSTATAAQALANLENNLPNSGGVLADWIGDNTLDQFGGQLKSFAQGLVDYCDVFAGSNFDASVVEDSAAAAQALSDLANTIPNSGGFISLFTGDNTLSGFGNNLKSFGQGLKNYADSVSGMDTSAVENSITAAQKLIDLSNGLENVGLFDQTLSSFGAQLQSFGYGLQVYYSYISGMDASVMNTMTTALTQLRDLGASFAEMDMSGFTSFSETLYTVATNAINTFVTEITNGTERAKAAISTLMSSMRQAFMTNAVAFNSTGTTLINNFITGVTNRKEATRVAGVNVKNALATGLRTNQEGFKTIGTTLINNFITGVTNRKEATRVAGVNVKNALATGLKTNQEEFKTIGTNTGNKFASGVRSTESEAQSAGAALSDSASAEVEKAVSRFEEAGKNAGKGFANEIRSYASEAVSAAKEMAQSAADAINSTLDINSPSKVTGLSGKFFVLGFANAVRNLSYLASDSASDMGKRSVSAFQKSVEDSGEAARSIVDLYPTITPVLDLSQIQNGSRNLGSIFANHSIALAETSTRQVSSIARHSSSNGASAESKVVSAQPASFNFTQNNYSPKALSNIEIYRQTRNLVSQAKAKVSK